MRMGVDITSCRMILIIKETRALLRTAPCFPLLAHLPAGHC